MTAEGRGDGCARPVGGRLRVLFLVGLVAAAALALAGQAQAARSLRASPFVMGGGTPTITSMSAHEAWTVGGREIWVEGTNLENVTNVDVGDNSVGGLYEEWGPELLKFIVPAEDSSAKEAGGHVRVSITTEAGTTEPNAFGEDLLTYVPPIKPKVTAVIPQDGPEGGGTTIHVTGQGFSEETNEAPTVLSVWFGERRGRQVHVLSPTELTAVSPPETAGEVDVTVETSAGESRLNESDKFKYHAPPIVESLLPSGGPKTGGNVVEILGKNFTEVESISFGGKPARRLVNSSEFIRVEAPAGTGTVDVTVMTAGGTSATGAGDLYRYTPDAPTVTGVSPSTGYVAGGGHVTLTGSGFDTAESVMFGGAAASIVEVASASEMVVAVPAASGAGTVDVTVAGPGGTSTTGSADHYTYLLPPPTVTSVSPSSGNQAGGTHVTLTGSGFDTAESVEFGAAAGTIVHVASANEMVVAAPAGSGIVDITVTGPGGTSTTGATDRYSYVAVPAPEISSTSPSELGCCGEKVMISGHHLDGATVTTPAWTAKGMTERELALTEDTSESLTVESNQEEIEAPGVQYLTVHTDGGTASTHVTFVPGEESYPEFGNCRRLESLVGIFKNSKCSKAEPAHHGKYEFTPGLSSRSVSFSAGTFSFGQVIKCASVSGTGTLATASEIDGVALTFAGCTHPEYGSCSNTGTAGQVQSQPLAVWLAWQPSGPKKAPVFALLPAALNGALAHFECGGHGITLTGAAGAVLKAGRPATSLAVAYTVIKRGRPAAKTIKWGEWVTYPAPSMEDENGSRFALSAIGTLTMSAIEPFEVNPTL